MTHKLAIIVRSDITMSKGKIVAQAGHAVVEATIKCLTNNIYNKWQSNGETIIVVKANAETLSAILIQAEKKEINHGQVCDAGLTQVKPGTITVGYVGPDLDSKIDKLIGQLKLL